MLCKGEIYPGQGEVVRDPAACKARVLRDLEPWAFDMASVVEGAPLDSIQRSRIFDRQVHIGDPCRLCQYCGPEPASAAAACRAK